MIGPCLLDKVNKDIRSRMMKKKIAVIGSGMAGLAAGWLCRKAGTDVTIFEAQSSRGMDFHTQVLDGNDGRSGHVWMCH